MQVPLAASKLVQFVEMGEHCSRLAAKKAMVHVMVRPITTHEMMENVLVVNILVPRLAYRNALFRNVKVCYLR